MRRSLTSLVVVAAVAGCMAGGPSSQETPELTEQYGCGFGFYLGSTDQTVGLFIDFSDFESAQRGEVPESSPLSDGPWEAKLEFGSDVFANWCDDVLEPGEPTPEIEEVWEVTGLIEISATPDPGLCGPAMASLRDLEAHGPDDEVMALGDIDVENEFWGCFAG